MSAKRKIDAVEPVLDPLDTNSADAGEPITGKKARTSTKKTTEASSAKSWRDIKLEGEDDGDVPVYDDCGEVRRKIRLLQKTPGWKVTHWLQEIGGINNNSFQRFMSAKGRNDGAANGTYYAAYVYFEKVRIFEGKKKTTKRLQNEVVHSNGHSLSNPPRYLWVARR